MISFENNNELLEMDFGPVSRVYLNYIVYYECITKLI